MSTTASIKYQYADGSNNTIRRTGVTYPNGRQVSYLYNGPDDRLSRVTAIANSPLGQGMRSYWRLDENVTSGGRLDSLGNNNLIDGGNNVGSASGLFGGKAAQFVAANSAVLAATTFNGLSYNGQTSFTTAGWIKFNSVSGTVGIWGKGNAGNANYTPQANRPTRIFPRKTLCFSVRMEFYRAQKVFTRLHKKIREFTLYERSRFAQRRRTIRSLSGDSS